MVTPRHVHVGMAELAVSNVPTVFKCLGLASCIAVYVVDPETRVGGIAHVVLPQSFRNQPVAKPGQFADTGIPELVKQLVNHGADRSRLVATVVGGAELVNVGRSFDERVNLGARNLAAVRRALASLELPVIALEVGGMAARSMVADTYEGTVTVKTPTSLDKTICDLNSLFRKESA